MAQNDLIVVGIDVAKDKVDACIRRFTLRQTLPNTAQGHRKLWSGRDGDRYSLDLISGKAKYFLFWGLTKTSVNRK
jgi:transposase